jgi:hypothetical protein
MYCHNVLPRTADCCTNIKTGWDGSSAHLEQMVKDMGEEEETVLQY